MDQIPFGNQFENALRSFIKGGSKRIAGQVGTGLTRGLAAATEPFFRKDMGERHFSGASLNHGLWLWAVATLVSGNLALVVNGIYSLIAFVTGIAMAVTFWRLGAENLRRLAQFREEGLTYHTRSRGVPRWDGGTEIIVRYGSILLLLVLSPVIGIAFAVSLSISASHAAQMEAAIRERYLDALDAQIEAQLLEDALLGNCPPEITYLYKPLPADMNPNLRGNIAAAAVGKPVQIVAQEPESEPKAFE